MTGYLDLDIKLPLYSRNLVCTCQTEFTSGRDYSSGYEEQALPHARKFEP
jgi:hypothetical protein